METLSQTRKSLYLGFAIYFIAIGVFDYFVIFGFDASAVPKTIPQTTANVMLQSMIQVDGILLGFVGAGYAAILSRGHEKSTLVRLFQSLPFVGSAGFLFWAVNSAFIGLTGTTGLANTQFAYIEAYSFNGILVLIFGVFALDEIKNVVERYFGGSPAAPAGPAPPKPPEPAHPSGEKKGAESGTPSSVQGFPTLRRNWARFVIMIVSLALVVLGYVLIPFGMELGYAFIGWGGGTLVTFLVVDVLLLCEDRRNWRIVEEKVRSNIRSELRGIRIDVMLYSGAEETAVTLPTDATVEEESRAIGDEQLKVARTLSTSIEALKERGLPNIGNVRDLFDSRADNVASFQSRYWSRLLEPDMMAYFIDLEKKLRRVQLSLDILRKYREFPEPAAELRELRKWEIASSQEALFQDMQSLLGFVIEGVDRGIVPYE